MGLNKKTQANYVRLKDGKFYLGKDKDTVYDEIEGKIVDMFLKDEKLPEGQIIKKLNLKIVDGSTEYLLSFPFDSSYTSSLVGFLKNADLTEPLVLVPSLKVEGDKERRALLVRQDGTWLKAFYTKANPNGLPAFKQVKKKSGKTEWDKEDFLEFLENVITNEFKPQLKGAPAPVATVNTPELSGGDDADPADDLPF